MRFPLSFVALLLLAMFSMLPCIVAEDFCGTNSNVTFVDMNTFDPQMANANFLKGNLRNPWPQIGNRRPIRYCYINEQARKTLRCSVQQALVVWARKIGMSNKGNGHSIAWIEAGDRTSKGVTDRKYCHDAFGKWNPAVKPDTLAIHLEEGVTPQATVGYQPEEWNNEAGRHKMLLPHGNVRIDRITHEFGHVLGMVHEQVRYDRDEYVEYRCSNLRDYNSALTQAILDGHAPDTAAKSLCEDQAFAYKYKFTGSAYTKNDEFKNIPFILDEGKFDYLSIMLYPSNAYSGPECQGTVDKLDACVLVALDRVGGVLRGKSFIQTNVEPSEGDVEFVRRYYPFIEGPAPVASPGQGELARATPAVERKVKGEELVKARSERDSSLRVHRIEVSAGDITFREL